MGTAVGRTLRIDAPSAEDLASFHRDGYVAFSSVFTDEGLEGITDEILRQPQVVAYLGMAEEERRRLDRRGVTGVGGKLGAEPNANLRWRTWLPRHDLLEDHSRIAGKIG